MRVTRTLSDADAYNFATPRWRRLANCPSSVCHHFLFCHAGAVYLLGGWDGSRMTNRHIYAHDPPLSQLSIVTATDAAPLSCTTVSARGQDVYVLRGDEQLGPRDVSCGASTALDKAGVGAVVNRERTAVLTLVPCKVASYKGI